MVSREQQKKVAGRLMLQQREKIFSFKVLIVFIGVLSLVMHWGIFSVDLIGVHVWRQTQTQTTIENFAREDFNILNPRINSRGSGNGIFRMEFPLMQWVFACFYKIFGNHLIISRILSFVIGIFTVAGIYFLVRNLFHDNRTAAVAAWCFNFSPLFYYYTLNPLPDNLALSCSVWSLALFFRWKANAEIRGLLLSAFFLCVGALCKLPFVLYATVPVIFFMMKIKKAGRNSLSGSVGALGIFLVCMLPFFAWYAWVIPGWQGNNLVLGIFSSDDFTAARAADILISLFISIFPELLLNYGSLLFFLAGIFLIVKRKSFRKKEFIPLAAVVVCLAGYFLYEINLLGKEHDYYLLPFLPFIFIVTAFGAGALVSSQAKPLRYFSGMLLAILPLTAFLRIDTRWNPEKPGFNKDLLTFKTELRSAVPDNALWIAGNDVSGHIFFYYLGKKGWSFKNDSLEHAALRRMISEGAQYLYSDSRKIDESSALKPFLGKMILQKGTVKVFSLNRQPP